MRALEKWSAMKEIRLDHYMIRQWETRELTYAADLSFTNYSKEH